MSKQIKDFTQKDNPAETDQLLIQEAGGTTKKTTIGDIVSSGTYTPTVTATSNIDGTSQYNCTYMRVGDVVTVMFSMAIDPTATGAISLEISLPISSNFLSIKDAAGTIANTDLDQGIINSNFTNDTAIINATVSTANNRSWYGTFQYKIWNI